MAVGLLALGESVSWLGEAVVFLGEVVFLDGETLGVVEVTKLTVVILVSGSVTYVVRLLLLEVTETCLFEPECLSEYVLVPLCWLLDASETLHSPETVPPCVRLSVTVSGIVAELKPLLTVTTLEGDWEIVVLVAESVVLCDTVPVGETEKDLTFVGETVFVIDKL